MAYEEIYKGLTTEEKERMIQMDIPKFEIVGEAGLTAEELKQGEKDLLRMINKFKGNAAVSQ